MSEGQGMPRSFPFKERRRASARILGVKRIAVDMYGTLPYA